MLNKSVHRRDFISLLASAASYVVLADIVEGTVVPSARTNRHIIRVEDLDLGLMSAGWSKPKKNRSIMGRPLSIAGKMYQHGIGTHAESIFRINLKKAAVQFTAKVGVDSDAKHAGTVIFEVWVDGKCVVKTPVMKGGQPAHDIHVNLRRARIITLMVKPGLNGINYGHADWIDPVITLQTGATAAPVALGPYFEYDELPDIASGDPPEPAFHGARVVGLSPGKLFM